MQNIESLTLASFATRDKKRKIIQVKRPKRHLGREFPPTAHDAIKLAIDFYAFKLDELGMHLRPPA